MTVLSYILIGLIGGLAGGALGLGGGAIMVPLLVFWAHLTQHQAQGTVIAVLTLPVFLLATIRYYTAGNLKIQIALFVAVGFIAGAVLGAHLVQGIPETTLKRMFGVFLILMGIKMAFLK